jgi:hypothetical protein
MTLSHVFTENDALYTYWLQNMFPHEHGHNHTTPLGKQRRFKYWLKTLPPESREIILAKMVVKVVQA